MKPHDDERIDHTKPHVPSWRPLGAALLASTSLHGLLLAIPDSYVRASAPKASKVIMAYLAEPKKNQIINAQESIAPPDPEIQKAHTSGSPGAEAPAVTPPRFAGAPDLSGLEALPAARRAWVKLRIYVSAAGRIDRLEVLEKHDVTGDFLALAYDAIGNAQVTPAFGEGGPVASTFDVVIGAEPPPVSSGQTIPAAAEN